MKGYLIMESEIEYLIYKHTNKINGKNYVGQTGQNPEDRWKNGYGYKESYIDENGNKKYSHFFNAIQKYGWDNFEHKVLIHGLTKEQADIWEKKLIKAWDLMNRDKGYNKKEGGSRGRHSDETIEKIRQANIGKKHTENSRAKISIAKKGKKISTYHKQKIRNAHIGKHVGVLNNMYGKTGEKNKLSKKVICLDNGIIYASVSEAEAKLKIKHVSDCCNFKRIFFRSAYVKSLPLPIYLPLSKSSIHVLIFFISDLCSL